MPLMVQGPGSVVPLRASPETTSADRASSQGEPAEGWRGRLDIGLVNNMPDGALKATERQFARLLAAASGMTEIRLHLFSLPQVPRSDVARAHMQGRYGDLAALETSRLDALIVTGAEPVAASLAEEPYWAALTAVVDWAEHNTVSTIWSCLAAHAAVLHLDGIRRKRLPEKRFGLYECVTVTSDGLFEGAPAGLRVPHSRWNDLDEGDLRSHGYRILSRSHEAGIDSFTKQWASHFVFLQGHPEYDVDTLFREYRRDAQRFLKGTRDRLPSMPLHYFDAATERALAAFAAHAAERCDASAWDSFPREWSVRPALVKSWQASSLVLYRNWLVHVAASAR